ncbi:hypothetical protein U9M48_009558 [Paspalum notatum var. saurae]|uniref:Ripening-related protein grip22 n=1 Tax=Paspalum notatum var. saurae TaxID=547442 RepID=A0AAQ3WF74_PASNO
MARRNAKKLAVLAAVLVLAQVWCGVVARQNQNHLHQATMMVNGFEDGEEGGDPAECDGKYHHDGEMLAGLSTVWYAGGQTPIRITSTRTGRSVVARVVDEGDSSGHGGCNSNVIVTSKAVWKALGLHTKLGQAHATMMVNGFEDGEEGGDPAECDGKYHHDGEMLAGLSTVWYAGGKRCHKPIRITSTRTGRSVVARVVDEGDSSGHGGCKNNVIVTSKAVWKALGLHTKLGQAHVTWSDA